MAQRLLQPGLSSERYPKIENKKNRAVRINSLSTSVEYLQSFKGAGSRNRKQTCYLHDLRCFQCLAIVFYTELGGWGEFTRKLLPKDTPVRKSLKEAKNPVNSQGVGKN